MKLYYFCDDGGIIRRVSRKDYEEDKKICAAKVITLSKQNQRQQIEIVYNGFGTIIGFIRDNVVAREANQ